jgi:sulfur carrier protein
MRIQVRLFASLRKGRFDACSVESGEGAAVGDILRILGIPEEEASLVFINGRSAGKDSRLRGDDRLAVFPPIGGG